MFDLFKAFVLIESDSFRSDELSDRCNSTEDKTPPVKDKETIRENVNNREGQTDSTPVAKYYSTCTIRSYPMFQFQLYRIFIEGPCI